MAVMVVAYNAPPMLLSNADNLLTYGDKLVNNNMIMDRSPLANEASRINSMPQSPYVETTSAPLLTLSDLTMTPDVR